MKKTEKALAILAKIHNLLESEEYAVDLPVVKARLPGLIRILKMHTSGFLPNDLQQVYLGEQIGKLDEFKEELCSGRQPKFWQTHRKDMVKCCIKAQGLIQRYATNYDETAASRVKSTRVEQSRQ